MSAVLDLPIPKPVRRGSMFDGHGARITRMYTGTLFAIRMWLRYFPHDCAADLLKASYARGKLAGLGDLAPREKPCSRSYYERKALSWDDRLRREREAREERGERFNSLARRQAS